MQQAPPTILFDRTGGGHSQLEEAMSIVGVPVMTKKSFIQTKRDIGEVWKKELLELMMMAGI